MPSVQICSSVDRCAYEFACSRLCEEASYVIKRAGAVWLPAAFAFSLEFMSYTQDGRPLAIQTPLGKDKLFLIGISGQERISQLFSFQLEVLAEKKTEVAFEKLLGQNVTVEIELPTKEKRFFSGICKQGDRGSAGCDLY